MKRITDRFLWKVYFTLMVILTFVSADTFSTRISDVIGLIVAVPAFIAMYGFCFRTAILKKEFWRVYFVICIFWNYIHMFVVGVGTELPDGSIQILDKNNYPVLIVSFIFLIPLILILYRYAFREEELWKLPNKR